MGGNKDSGETPYSRGMENMIRPTSVQKWSRCPTLWYLTDIEGWRQPDSAWSPERDIGTAIHAAIAWYWRNDHDIVGAGVEAERVLRSKWVEGSAFEIEAHIPIVHKTLLAVWKWIETNMSHVRMVIDESPLGADGHTTPDLVIDSDGDLVVTDWKSSLNLPAEKMVYRLEGAERDHQFWHYIMAVSDRLERPVKRFRKVVIGCTPKPIVKATEFTVEKAAFLSWFDQTIQKWEQMEEMKDNAHLVYRREEGCKPFGEKWPCPMFEACWTCHGDREKMANFYIREEKRDDA